MLVSLVFSSAVAGAMSTSWIVNVTAWTILDEAAKLLQPVRLGGTGDIDRRSCSPLYRAKRSGSLSVACVAINK